MTLYVDIIFLENLVMNLIIILATGIILKQNKRIIRYLIASVIGSIYAIIIYVSKFEFYSSPILKIILSIIITYIAFTPQRPKELFKFLMIFYLTSFTFGGVAFALLYWLKPTLIKLQNGVLIGTYPIKIIIAGGFLGFFIITVSFKSIKERISKKDIFCNIELYEGEKSKEIKAIFDTGNFLKDPITKAPVIVIESRALTSFLPNNVLDNISKIMDSKEVELGNFESKVRLIPFKSLGKENGMLVGLKIDGIKIVYQNEEKVIEDVIIGIYNGILSKVGKYERTCRIRHIKL